MPTPTPTPPPAPASQSSTPAFFIPQNATTPAKNISESPVLSGPAAKSSPAAKIKSPDKKPFFKNKIVLGLGAVVAVLVLIGGGAGIYLSQTSEDTRQQASTPTGSAKITVSPSTGTFKANTTQQVNFSLDLTTTPVTLSDIELSVSFTGAVPTDLQFVPQPLENFSQGDVNVTNSDTGKTVTIIFKPTNTQGGFSATTSNIPLGTLSFTSPAAGQLNVRFNASESKVLLQSNIDILLPPSLVTYSFESDATPTPPLDETIDDASSSGNKSALNSTVPTSTPTPTLAGVGGAAPTATPVLLAQINTTTTPTRTPTKTPTVSVTKTPSLTPTPTETRDSSLPADTQETPVSGSADLTLTLFGSGLLFILIGFFLIPKKQKIIE